MATADIGLIGLAVMGSNLALNIAEKGYTVAVHNRSPGRIDEFVEEAKAQGLDKNTIPKYDLAEFVQAVKALPNMNRHFARMWQIPETLLVAGVDAAILTFLDSQLEPGLQAVVELTQHASDDPSQFVTLPLLEPLWKSSKPLLSWT